MAKWTVALFGHYKPDHYVRDKTTGLDVSRHIGPPTGINLKKYNIVQVDTSKMAQPGDVIVMKSVNHPWTPLEKKHFLILTVDGPTFEQIDALAEPYYDLNSYRIYDPMSLNDWYVAMQIKFTNLNDQKALANLEIYKVQWYDLYIANEKNRSRYPIGIIQNRRYHLSLADLDTKGINTNRMLDKEDEYIPTIGPINHTEIYDKIKKRYVLQTDNLELIKPLTDSELRTP